MKKPRKQKISDYILEEFGEMAIDPRTVIAQIQRGELPGQKIGGLWFVIRQEPEPAPAAPRPSTNNATADSILQEIGCLQ